LHLQKDTLTVFLFASASRHSHNTPEQISGPVLKTLLHDAWSIMSSDEGAHIAFSTDGTFNGKLEEPVLLVDGSVLARWDFSETNDNDENVDMSSWSIPPQSANGALQGGNLLLHNAPTRAIKSHLWDGSEMNWKHKTKHYAAIYFHDDNVYDFKWESDFQWTIPFNCPSGIYMMHIQVEHDEN
jgi:hypothetical protein